MKTKKFFQIIIFAFAVMGFQKTMAQQAKPENWTKDQLIEPANLTQILNDNEKIPLIYCVGPGVVIPHSIDIGMTRDEKNIQKLRDSLSNVPRDADIVIYCGCCPFDHCPNVRPAIALLNEMKFTNYHLLNLPHNIKTDWIAKGYPQIEN